MESTVIKLVNKSSNPLPEYQISGSSGFDIRADLDEPVLLGPMEIKAIPTGLYFEIPEGFEVQIRSRSGLALKQGLAVLNSPGTIDASYRGEILVILINFSNLFRTISSGDRVAQGVLSRVENASFDTVLFLSDTLRGEGGFGHTGVST